jgi:replicative DNA helicase
MKLSAPIYQLKRKARLLSRQQGIPLHEALDRLAAKEGFRSWGLLAAKAPTSLSAGAVYRRLNPGDLVLVGARPCQGKTLMSLGLAVEAMRSGNRGAFFTLEYTERHMQGRFRAIGVDQVQFREQFEFDNSDDISSDYIMRRLGPAPNGTLAVVDYLQILDQRRDKPELMVQVRALKSFARDNGLIIVFISQIDRTYDQSTKPCPGLEDVRLPNPLDLALFDKALFLHNGEVRFRATG